MHGIDSQKEIFVFDLIQKPDLVHVVEGKFNVENKKNKMTHENNPYF